MEEFAARLLDDILQSSDTVDEATGALSNVKWSSESLYEERRCEKERDELKFAQQFNARS